MIYIVKHKESNNPVPEGYKELFVGPLASRNPRTVEPAYQTINHLNPFLSEATGLYEIWKNEIDDIVGLCHYRRFFKWRDGILPFETASKMVEDRKSIIVCETENNYPYTCAQYLSLAFGGKFVFLKYFKMICDANPEAAQWLMNSVDFHSREMFVCAREVMSKVICEPLFELMIPMAERFEKEDASNPSVDPRFLSHVAERLISFFVEKSGLRLNALSWFDGQAKMM